jgi:hypothetical protein
MRSSGSIKSGLGRDGSWLSVMAALALVEFAWWAIVWSQGIAPAPFIAPYLAGAGATFGAALALRLLSRRNLPSKLSLALGVLVVAASASLFLPLKFAIPKEIPFWLDAPLAGFERQIFGSDPWFVLNAILGWATPAIDLIYAFWLPTQLTVMFSVMLQPPSAAKSRALTAYFICWFVLGVAAAALLSSVGPIFYDRLYGGADFSGLAEALRTRGATFAVGESDAMWAAYAADRPSMVSGISAMPSLHVAISFWIVLAARAIAPRLKWLALAYFLFIWIASVQLGWHYVLDGAAGALGVLAIWVFAGPIERRVAHGRSAMSGDTKVRLASTENSRSRE